MKTIATSSLKIAANAIRRGDLAAFPTETVYGLGANALDRKAVKKIFRAKGRPSDNPLIVHIHSKGQLAQVAANVTPLAKKIIDALFPGPVSVVLRKNRLIPKEVTAGLGTVCVRMPSLRLARRFLKECGVPVAAPSANLSGRPSPTTYAHVLEDLGGRIPVVLKGPACRHGLESTVVDCTGRLPRILRSGSVPAEKIMEIAGLGIAAGGAGARAGKGGVRRARSPGMKYRHYAPNGRVAIIKSPAALPKNAKAWAYIGLSKPEKTSGCAKCLVARGKNDYARNLFAFFRDCDRLGAKRIYCQQVSESGQGMAIMERLLKASGK
ncbi:MAG: L-threonylcarbamoyladenylate synthase [Candidatus Micrarchaeia archaeon]